MPTPPRKQLKQQQHKQRQQQRQWQHRRLEQGVHAEVEVEDIEAIPGPINSFPMSGLLKEMQGGLMLLPLHAAP